jgi:hypothetical protein
MFSNTAQSSSSNKGKDNPFAMKGKGAPSFMDPKKDGTPLGSEKDVASQKEPKKPQAPVFSLSKNANNLFADKMDS